MTEEKSERLVRLPFFNSFSRSDQNRVIEVIHDFND